MFANSETRPPNSNHPIVALNGFLSEPVDERDRLSGLHNRRCRHARDRRHGTQHRLNLTVN
ncbi:MAG: hypothetical protein ACI8Y4_000941 [Candidatus Poriferisodalaceae bacterium]|jgi:hypothetical protein